MFSNKLGVLVACLALAACSPKYVSVVVLETNCGDFDGAIFTASDGSIHVEHDPSIAAKIAHNIPKEHGIKVIDGPCRATDLPDQPKPRQFKEPKPTDSQSAT